MMRTVAGRACLSISELIPAFRLSFPWWIVSRPLAVHGVGRGQSLSSIFACVTKAARENARAVRGALTTESWETQNQTWLALQRHLSAGCLEKDPAQFFEWSNTAHTCGACVAGHHAQGRGAALLRLGTFVERADNTARLLM